jgi:hypothetical protein
MAKVLFPSLMIKLLANFSDFLTMHAEIRDAKNDARNCKMILSGICGCSKETTSCFI